MPELPEVETIRRGLEKYLVGHCIEDIHVKLNKIVRGDIGQTIGAKISRIRRFGKGLVIDLSNGYSIAIHVKMTGQLIYQGRVFPPINIHLSPDKVGSLPNKWTHVTFSLDHDAVLYYNDQRQFGWIHAVKTEEISRLQFFQGIGPEPMKDLTLVLFETMVKKTNKLPIKQLLMDQKRISGIGNIYANDALFLAKIHPARPSSSLREGEIYQLYQAIETVLKKGIEAGGASQEHFVNALGEEGGYQQYFQVYAQEGKQCKVCKEVIEKIKLGGRGTFFVQTVKNKDAGKHCFFLSSMLVSMNARVLFFMGSMYSEKVIISVGGSLVVPTGGIDTPFLKRLNSFIRNQLATNPNRQFFLVIGGGATTRHYQKAAQEVIGHELVPDDLDWLGIHATRLNAQLIRTIFRDVAHPHLIKHFEIIRKVSEPVVVAAGWKPGWSTDYCAVLLCEDYGVRTVINMSNISKVYNKDPKEFPDAKPIDKIAWGQFRQIIGDKWSPGMNAPFDPIAAQKAQQLQVKVVVLGSDFDNLEKYFNGDLFVGTVIE